MGRRLKTQFLIIGGGIIGLTIARELLLRGVRDIILIDKEPSLGRHASGRNSGVLHAGIYYPKDTMKARFCQVGSRAMKAYCLDNGLPLSPTGKVIVTRSEQELAQLQQLFERAQDNGARVTMIDQQELSDIEPCAATVGRAIYSPDTAIVDPLRVVETLANSLTAQRVKVLTGCAFKCLRNRQTAITPLGDIEFKMCINAAGSYADKVAHQFGVGKEYALIPFKGTYRKLAQNSSCRINGNIYPVPDLRNPFLGVHFTRNIHGEVTVGPTAIPCFGRENYRGLSGINGEIFSIIGGSGCLLLKNPGFRRVAATEPRKYFSKYLYRDAAKLVKQLQKADLQPCIKVGIRPQLIHRPSRKLVMDFLLKETDNSIHVLNAISPAFTCAMAISGEIVESFLGPDKSESYH